MAMSLPVDTVRSITVIAGCGWLSPLLCTLSGKACNTSSLLGGVSPRGPVSPSESGGMSVTLDDPFEIPPHRRPASLGGDGDWPLWRILSDDLPERLATRNDRDFHGLVEPSQQMSADEYVQSLESTQPKWDLET